METFDLPHVILPTEFCSLLKLNLAVANSSALVLEGINKNKALYISLEKIFKEFDDGRGFEKTMAGLGWHNFRDRLASIYFYRWIHGRFPHKAQPELIEDVKVFENQFQHHSLNGYSRLFLLGFYLKMVNLRSQRHSPHSFDFKIPDEIVILLRLSQIKSEKIDWLILILTHLIWGLGYDTLLNYLASGKKMDHLYELLDPDARRMMFQNLLAYGFSIGEEDFFLYQKI
jgi:hypothetical protein